MVDNDKKGIARSRLLKEHTPSEQGDWKIYGEDANNDLGGYRNIPLLATVTGTYSNIVEYAVNLDGFFGWGFGGSIVKLAPPRDLVNVDTLLSSTKLRELNEEKANLKTRLAEIELEADSIVRGKRS